MAPETNNSKIEEEILITSIADVSFGNSLVNTFLHIINQADVEVFADDVLLNDKNENTDRFTLITSDPKMPSISIKNNMNLSIKGRLKIEYTKISGGNTIRKWIDYYPNETNNNVETETIEVDGTWSVDFGDDIRGGKATLEYVEGEDEWIDENIKTFVFHIRGTNPTKSEVMAYINTQGYKDEYWFFILLTKHESGTHEGNEYRQFNPGTNYTTGEGSYIALPNFGAPRGFGLYQLDNYGIQRISSFSQADQNAINQLGDGETFIDSDYKHWNEAFLFTGNMSSANVCSNQAVWNWKTNIDEAKSLLDVKKQTIINKYNIWVSKANEWNANHPNDLVEQYSDQVEGNITFSSIESELVGITNVINNYFNDSQNSDTIKSFIDACLIRYFNGGYYHKLKQSGSQKPLWEIDRESPQSGFYVEHVCEELDETLE